MALRNHMTKAVDFFSLFFTEELIKEICNHTNTHVWQKINCKQIYADKNEAWKEKNQDEMKKFIACLIHQGLVLVPTYHRYWRTRSLYHGLWARTMISQDRFIALLSVLYVVDPSNETNKLRKVRTLLNMLKSKC